MGFMPRCAIKTSKDVGSRCRGMCNGWVDDDAAGRFLEARGYSIDRPLIKTAEHAPTVEESAAMCYLVREWDWSVEGDAK